MTLHTEQDAIKQAIKQAVEAGYPRIKHLHSVDDENGLWINFCDDDGNPRQLWGEAILQDPAFWQALGKARGWAEEVCVKCGCADFGSSSLGESGEYFSYCRQCHANLDTDEDLGEAWKVHALRYFENRLSNGDMRAYLPWKYVMRRGALGSAPASAVFYSQCR